MAAYENGKRYKGITSTLVIKTVKLSRQQKYMLTLLAQGYKNSKITEITGLSINTIRAYLIHNHCNDRSEKGILHTIVLIFN